MEWQPIETGPTGEDVLVFSTIYGIAIAYRTQDHWSRDLGYACDCDEGFYINTPHEAGLTHWMPLPKPPTLG